MQGDILLYTSADVGFSGPFTERVADACQKYGACHMKRKEPGDIRDLPTVEDVEKAPEYCGLDACAFTVDWWDRHREMIPSMHVGFYAWDSIIRNMIRRSGGVELKNAIWHPLQTVNSWNASLDTIYKHPVNHKNRMALYEYLLRYGGSEADHLFDDQEIRKLWK